MADFFSFLENRCDAVETFSNSVDQKQNSAKPQISLKANHSRIQSTKSNKGLSGKSALKSASSNSNSSEIIQPLSCQSSIVGTQPSTSSQVQQTSSRLTHQPPQTSQSSGHMAICLLCPDTLHNLYQCKKFKNWDVKSRREFVRDKNYCFNCLFRNHSVKNCPCTFSCQVCKKRHHTLVHEGDKPQITTAFVNACHTSQKPWVCFLLL